MVHELAELRDRTGVFRDRRHAGAVLAGMLEGFRESDARLLAVPAGGVPVAAALADLLGLGLDVAVVSKILLPWTTEAGYGAVAFDGSVRLNEALLRRVRLSEEEVRRGTASTLERVRRRIAVLRGASETPELSGLSTILVDDGLASGFTMRAAVEAVRNAGARRIVVAVPTGSLGATESLAPEVDALYCANVRGGRSFAVADAYDSWSDVGENEAAEILATHRGRVGSDVPPDGGAR